MIVRHAHTHTLVDSEFHISRLQSSAYRHPPAVSNCILYIKVLYHFDQFGRHAPRLGVVWTKLVLGHRSQPIWLVSKCGS